MSTRYAPIGDYGIIGNLYTIALVGHERIDRFSVPASFHFADGPPLEHYALGPPGSIVPERGGRIEVCGAEGRHKGRDERDAGEHRGDRHQRSRVTWTGSSEH